MAETMQEALTAPRPRTTPMNHRVFGIVVAGIVFILDQATKWVVTNILQLRERGTIELLPIFDLKWVENRGVSMGLLTAGSEGQRWMLVALTVGLSVLVVAWLWREKRRDDVIALSMVVGGGLGNILDRVRFGYVVDFADLHFGDIHPFLVFNVSDAAITIGLLLFLLRGLLRRDANAVPREV